LHVDQHLSYDDPVWWDPKYDKWIGGILGLLIFLIFFLTIGLKELLDLHTVTP
jgi:hypothetical protein